MEVMDGKSKKEVLIKDCMHSSEHSLFAFCILQGLTDTKWVGKAVFTPYLGKVEVSSTTPFTVCQL